MLRIYKVTEAISAMYQRKEIEREEKDQLCEIARSCANQKNWTPLMLYAIEHDLELLENAVMQNT